MTPEDFLKEKASQRPDIILDGNTWRAIKLWMEEYHQYMKSAEGKIDNDDEGVGFINFKEPEQNSKPTVDKLINI